MIYIIGLILIAAITLIVLRNKKKCKCNKCNEDNCKCAENNCADDCKCHDNVVEMSTPYLNGHSKKITAEPVDDIVNVNETPVTEPSIDEIKEEEISTAEPTPKPEPKKEEPKKKPAPKKNPKKKGKGKK